MRSRATPASLAYASSNAAAARMFATGSRRASWGVTPASDAPRSNAAPRNAITPNAAGRPGNSSAPWTICQRVSAQPTPASSAGGTWNSAPAAANTESNGEGRATGAACWAAIPAARGEGQGPTGAPWQAATRTTRAGLATPSRAAPYVHHQPRRRRGLRHPVRCGGRDSQYPLHLSLEVAHELHVLDCGKPGRALPLRGARIALLIVPPGGLEAHHEPAGTRERHRISRSAAADRRGHVFHVVARHAIARKLEHDAIIAGARVGLDRAEQRRRARPDRSCSVNRRGRAGERG